MHADITVQNCTMGNWAITVTTIAIVNIKEVKKLPQRNEQHDNDDDKDKKSPITFLTIIIKNSNWYKNITYMSKHSDS